MYKLFYELFQSMNQEQRMEFLKQLYTKGCCQFFSTEKPPLPLCWEERADFIL